MVTVHILWHTHRINADEEDEKLIGVYETRAAALAAQQRLSTKPGFAQCPEGFEIDEYTLGQDHWTEGYVTV